MTNKEMIEDLRTKLHEDNYEIGEVLLKLEKAHLLLESWLEDYSFAKEPDPKLLFDKNIPDDDIHKKQTLKWCWNYNKICGLIDIVFDYICDSEKSLEKIANSH